jgi:hypothetical protein
VETAETMNSAFFAFSSIAAFTLLFSYRPRLFMRVFVPREELIPTPNEFFPSEENTLDMRIG